MNSSITCCRAARRPVRRAAEFLPERTPRRCRTLSHLAQTLVPENTSEQYAATANTESTYQKLSAHSPNGVSRQAAPTVGLDCRARLSPIGEPVLPHPCYRSHSARTNYSAVAFNLLHSLYFDSQRMTRKRRFWMKRTVTDEDVSRQSRFFDRCCQRYRKSACGGAC